MGEVTLGLGLVACIDAIIPIKTRRQRETPHEALPWFRNAATPNAHCSKYTTHTHTHGNASGHPPSLAPCCTIFHRSPATRTTRYGTKNKASGRNAAKHHGKACLKCISQWNSSQVQSHQKLRIPQFPDM